MRCVCVVRWFGSPAARLGLDTKGRREAWLVASPSISHLSWTRQRKDLGHIVDLRGLALHHEQILAAIPGFDLDKSGFDLDKFWLRLKSSKKYSHAKHALNTL